MSEALESVGSPLGPQALRAIEAGGDDRAMSKAVQEALDPLCLAAVTVRKDGGVHAVARGGRPVLVEHGWRTYLVKVFNEAGAEATLDVQSPNSRPVPGGPRDEIGKRWLELSMYDGRPMTPRLSGLGLEYRIVQLFSRDAGAREAMLWFDLAGWAGRPGRPASKWQEGFLIKEWGFEEGTDGWSATKSCRVEGKDGALVVTPMGGAPGIEASLYFGAPPRGDYVLKFLARAGRGARAEVSWASGGDGRFDDRRKAALEVEPGEGREYAVVFPSEGGMLKLRIDIQGDAGPVAFDRIRLSHAERTGPSESALALTFDCRRSTTLTFDVKDEAGKDTFAAFVIEDGRGRVYPSQSKRVAPDFFFQRQVYRTTGETVQLPVGAYTIACSRGPESIPETKAVEVKGEPVTLSYRARRWVDPYAKGWVSGDHHIHAAGCAHYENPTKGVHAEDMIRHCMGEDLKIGCNLTWGPCFDYQKQFFAGKVDAASRPPYLLRYDVEVSGFGSARSGHLCLLRLRDQIYPGGDSKDHWPTLGLNTLRWAKAQGAVCGPAHSSIGLTNFVGRVERAEDGPDGLPTYNIPDYAGIGANEFIVDITHEVPGPGGGPVPAVDFISTMNTDRKAEWNMWYHTLNCGFRVRASGETDFPCVSGERVGLGRVYVKVDPPLSYDRWCEGLRDGRSYVSDGTCHLMDFRMEAGGNGVAVGERGSELRLAGPGNARVTVVAGARRDEPGELPVEVVVNGLPVATRAIAADGAARTLSFEVPIKASSWVAVRAFPFSHTNPIFVLVGGKPIRASRQSAEWCLRGVDQCWKAKKPTYAEAEQEQAESAYEHARKAYRRIRDESAARNDRRAGEG
ncbi:CehA/McbA family metallohydrolase [Singulisphaera sp. PoT]|uniref:CehA/McbA family metallohydrolase n=1 Tax=Singulisphaera sp. PoT TaxID=3411797 RepID=UPI003BF46CE5